MWKDHAGDQINRNKKPPPKRRLSPSERVMNPPRCLLTLAQSVSKCHKAFAITPARTAKANRRSKCCNLFTSFREGAEKSIAFFKCLCYNSISKCCSLARSVMNFGRNKGAAFTGGFFVCRKNFCVFLIYAITTSKSW